MNPINNLASLLENLAEGVEPDVERAVKLYERAVENGNLRTITTSGAFFRTERTV